MQLLAAAAPPQPSQPSPFQSAPVQQAPQYQNTTMQPDRPVYRPSLMARTISLVVLAGYICLLVFIVVMTYRFVRATEKIADKIDKGIILKKEDATTPSQS
jgi:hypothetical protein